MKNIKLEQLLKHKPKLLKSKQPEQQLNNSQKEFSLNLDQRLFTIAPIPKIVRPQDLPQKETKQYVEEIEVVDIDASDSKFASIIPKKIEDDPITNLDVQEDDQEFEPNRLTYREEEEKTKQFIIEALSEELCRLDKTTLSLMQEAQRQNEEMGEMQRINEGVQLMLREQVKDQTRFQRIKYLEDQIELDQKLKMKNPQRLDLEYMNEQMQDVYQKNQDLIQEVDLIREQIKKSYNIPDEDSQN